MTPLLFGGTRRVDAELARRASVGAVLVRLRQAQAVLKDPAACAAAGAAYMADVVINAAACSVVDDAEEEEALATVNNGCAPMAMVAWASASLGVPFLQILTDCVFDGSGKAFARPSDPAAPLGCAFRGNPATDSDSIRPPVPI